MYHEDGIRVRLEACGNEIEDIVYPGGQDPAEPDWKDTRAIIQAEPNTPFTIILELTENFRRYSADALKLIVAIGHNQQTTEDFHNVQAWHIPLRLSSRWRDSRRPTPHLYRISQQLCWDDKSCEPLTNEIRIPAPKSRSHHHEVLWPLADFKLSS